MLDPVEFWNYWGVFPGDPLLNDAILPPFNFYPGNLPGSARLRLLRSSGGKPYNVDIIKLNFESIRIVLNNLSDVNFKEYGNLATTKFLGSNNTAIVNQDETTNQPRLDLTNVTYNRIPRIDEDGRFPMPNSNFATPAKGRIISPDGTIWVNTFKDSGYMLFATESTARAWASVNGWTTSAPSVTAAVNGFAIDFIEGKSLWYIYRDTDVIAVIDGNVQIDNFKNTVPGDVDTNVAEEAFMLFNETDDRIEFWCKTTADAAIRGVGYIDSTGLNDGEA